MYRQFDSSSDKPKSAARLLAEAAFAPPSASRHAADHPAPVVKVVNRRFTPQRYDQLASYDGAGDVSQTQQTAVATKTARVFLLPAQAVEAGFAAESDSRAPMQPGLPAAIPAATPAAVQAATTAVIPAASTAGMPGMWEPASPTAAPAALFADLSDSAVEPQRRTSRFWRKSRRGNPHGPVRVIYSAPPALVVAPQTDDEETSSEPQQLESILFLQRQMAQVDALLADIQFAENFDIDVDAASSAAQLRSLLAELDRLSAQFPDVG